MLGVHHESLMVGVYDGVERGGGGWLGRNGLAFHSEMNIFFQDN